MCPLPSQCLGIIRGCPRHTHTLRGTSASFLIPTTTYSKATLVWAGCTLEPPRYHMVLESPLREPCTGTRHPSSRADQALPCCSSLCQAGAGCLAAGKVKEGAPATGPGLDDSVRQAMGVIERPEQGAVSEWCSQKMDLPGRAESRVQNGMQGTVLVHEILNTGLRVGAR